MALCSLPNELLHDCVSYLSTSSVDALSRSNRDLYHRLTPLLFARALDPAISHQVLSYAVKHGSLSLTQHLLTHDVFGSTPYEICTPKCTSPLQVASTLGQLPIVRAILNHYPSLNTRLHSLGSRTYPRTPMVLAAANGQLDIVRLFTDRYMAFNWPAHPHLDRCDMDIYHPLKAAIQNMHDPIVRFLLHHLNPNQWTRIAPHAAGAGLCQLVQELLPLLDTHRTTSAGFAIQLAAANGHQRCVEMLAAHVDKTAFPRVLRAAASAGHDGIVGFLLALMPGSAAAASTAALCDAVDGGNRDVLNLLLAYGADLNATIDLPGSRTPGTILQYVARLPRRHPGINRIRAVLLCAGAKPDAYAQVAAPPPPPLMHGDGESLGVSRGSVRFRIVDGGPRPRLRKGASGVYTADSVDWNDSAVVETLAAQVETRFVTAPRWF